MKTNALYVQNEASKKFNPYVLKDFLMRTEDGTVIVDRSRLLKNNEDKRFFFVVLNKDYKWNYRHPDTATVYYEIQDGRIYGGIFEPNLGCLTRQIIAVKPGERIVDIEEYCYNAYFYNADMYAEIVNSIANS